jgi:hypothetical protein
MSDTITISRSEYDELINIKNSLPGIIEDARANADKERLKRLYIIDTPEKRRERSKRYYEAHKDVIKARRLKKKETAGCEKSQDPPITS